jgi:hypothetical protein
LGPGELRGDGAGGAAADSAHGAEEFAKAGGVGVEGVKAAITEFALRLAGAQSFGQATPLGVEAVVGHLKDAADVGGLAAVEEEIGRGSVGVGAPPDLPLHGLHWTR